MRIALLTAGSRGDVQPYLALARALARSGHACTLVTQRVFAPLAAEYGVTFHAAGGDDWPTPESVRERVRNGELAELAGKRNSFSQLSLVAALFARHMTRFTADALPACEGVDAVAFAPMAAVAGHSLAEKLRVPFVPALLAPAFSTREFPSVLFPPRASFIPGYNRLSHWAAERLLWRLNRESAIRLRRDVLGLPPYPRSAFELMHRAEPPVLVGVSPNVVPRPRDWAPYLHLTGYWFLDEPSGWNPPARIARFLASGSPPVCVGFGSMVSEDPRGDVRIVAEALDRVGRRGILLSGWAGLDDHAADLPSSILPLDSIPHSWLFPRVAAVVHHGGAGTTAAALRAGVPQVVVPFITDQPFWGDRVRRLGVGPAPIPRARLTAERLARAIACALERGAMTARARDLGHTIRAEDGARLAVEILERELGRGRRRAPG
ncbi:glycosyltransferase [Anaeromyxobacter sp. Fw109-5]|uniref:glycosyltransferase n=1 Tax=Anaeromyxobacter sp. (strain Fw109-5) TaxID=404589 RepID=UPI0002DC4362|nr:glycosyltransferase [Anaeromyxobacter sp. Fw109-5]